MRKHEREAILEFFENHHDEISLELMQEFVALVDDAELKDELHYMMDEIVEI